MKDFAECENLKDLSKTWSEYKNILSQKYFPKRQQFTFLYEEEVK